MASHKKKTKTHFADEAEEMFDPSIGELAEAVAEDIQENHMNALEPFEHYIEKVRAKVHSDIGVFRHRFSKGYRILLEELSREEDQSREKK